MKKNWKLLLAACLTGAALTGMATACGSTTDSGNSSSDDSSTVEQPSQVEISIVGSSSMTEFETITLSAVVTGTSEAVEWTSSDSSVATVQGGVVTALKAGTVEITASVGDVFATHTVTVAKTTVLHELAFSVSALSMFEGESSSVDVAVKYNGSALDNELYGLEYAWSIVNGDGEVATVTPSENGSSLTVVGNKPGSVTYQVEVVARGYTVREEFTITVLQVSKELGFENDKFAPGETAYSLDLTFGSEETEQMTIGNVVYVLNGEPTSELADVSWTLSNDETVSLEGGVLKALKAGTVTMTGTAAYMDETLTVSVVISVSKMQVQLTDVLTVETAQGSVELPLEIQVAAVEKVSFNQTSAVFDKANEKGSIDGNTVTFAEEGIPVKMSELGLGKTMTVETDKAIYTVPVDVYTMIISNKQELDSWQEIAAENAVKAGLCIEAQKGFVLSGYFVLDSNIVYDGVWATYKTYSEIWSISTANPNNTELKEAEGVIDESWNYGIEGGFQGVFDGQGYNIQGMETKGTFSGFIVVNGKNGVVKNLSFTDAKVGEESSLLIVNGQGTVQNVYMEINSFGEGAVTFFRSSSAPIRTVENVLIDVTDCGLSTLGAGWLASQCGLNSYKGVYVVGVGESLADKLFDEAKNCTAIGGFETLAALLSDEAQGATVKAWDSNFWEISDGYVLPKSIVDFYKGAITFTNTEEKINLNGQVTFGTDKDAKYIVYSLKNEDDNAVLNGNVLSLKEGATVGSTITVVATSLIDGETAEYTLTVAADLVKETIAAKFYAEAASENTAVLQNQGFAVGNTYVVTVNGENTTATVETEGQLTVQIADMAVSSAGNMSVYTVICKNDSQELTFSNVVAITKVLKDAQDLGALNASEASGHITGYYVLGGDIDCAGVTFRSNARDANKAFKGTFDGCGYTVSNLQAGSNGIFNLIVDGTVKNVNFVDASIVKDNYHFTALLAGQCWGKTTIENVNVVFKSIEWPINNVLTDWAVTGLLVARLSNTSTVAFKNITLDATGLAVTNALGSEISGVSFENVVIKGNSYGLIGCTGANSSTGVAEWPTGVKFVVTTAYSVTLPAESNYYTFSGASSVIEGNSYTFTVTEKVSGLNDFIVLVNGKEITGSNGTYTVENVSGDLTVKVLHGYIEYGEKVTVTYNEDGSIKIQNALFSNAKEADLPWVAYISADYIEYMISQGYKSVSFTVQVDGAIMAQAIASYNGKIFVYHLDGTAKGFEQSLGDAATNDLLFWGQNSGGSGNAIKDQGGYLTITDLTFVK